MLDRIVVIALTALFALAWLHNPKGWGQWVYRTLGLLLAITGIAITARHLWILHLPADQMPDCMPNFQYMIENFPLLEALKTILQGSKECAEQGNAFMGLSLPGWTMVGFVVIAIGCLVPKKALHRASSKETSSG